jgi:hypothetical protein
MTIEECEPSSNPWDDVYRSKPPTEKTQDIKAERELTEAAYQKMVAERIRQRDSRNRRRPTASEAKP